MIKVNLLSPEKKDITPGAAPTEVFSADDGESKLNIPAIVGASVLTLFIIGGLYLLQSNRLDNTKKHLVERRARLTELEEVLQTLKMLENTKKVLKSKVEVIQSLNAKRQVVVKMMDQLSLALPEMVWLKSANFRTNSLTISGSALSNNLIADFINNLKSTGYFKVVEFKDSVPKKKSGIDVYSFRLNCTFSVPSKKKGMV